MNDFTKEELYKICAIVTSYFCDISIRSVDEDLINKIEAMIDNYCEHSNTKGVSEMDMDYRAICADCGVLL